MEIKLKVNQLIVEKGLVKKFVANKLEVSENTLRNWDAGKSFPRLDQAVKLADLLDCKITDLYDRI